MLDARHFSVVVIIMKFYRTTIAAVKIKQADDYTTGL